MKRKKKKLIKNHLERLKELKKKIPKAYWPIEGSTEIRYGFMDRKTITAKEIDNYAKRKIRK